MAARVVRSSIEQPVWDRFMEGGYQAIGCCANPACEDPGAVVMVAGVRPSARVCLTCFEFQFDCIHPSVRKLAGLGRRP